MPDHRSALHDALSSLQAARRDAQIELDAHVQETLAAPARAGARDEQLEQSLAALVRLLDAAGKDVRDAIATMDQRDRGDGGEGLETQRGPDAGTPGPPHNGDADRT